MMRKMSPLVLMGLVGLAFALMPGTAAAQSYSGTWSLKASLPPGFGDTGCLTLVDDGIVNGVHSGTATVSGDLGGQGTGNFVIINSLLVINFDDGGEGVSSTGVYIAHAAKGNIASGFLENVYGGYAFPYGALAFGPKGSC
jgi:hypothetical protein